MTRDLRLLGLRVNWCYMTIIDLHITTKHFQRPLKFAVIVCRYLPKQMNDSLSSNT